MATYHVVGVMSGTSLDGLDVAFCMLQKNNNIWSFQIQSARTVPYDRGMVEF
jgi:anhydro-N-acetylmuramic acid kinase